MSLKDTRSLLLEEMMPSVAAGGMGPSDGPSSCGAFAPVRLSPAVGEAQEDTPNLRRHPTRFPTRPRGRIAPGRSAFRTSPDTCEMRVSGYILYTRCDGVEPRGTGTHRIGGHRAYYTQTR